MSTLKSDNSDLTINADGSGKSIKFHSNGVEKASISSAGAFTSTSIDATKLTGALPAISGASLTGISGGIVLSGSTSNSGGITSGSTASILATLSSIDLSSYEGKRLVVYGSTAIAEQANTSNTSLVALYLVVGSTTLVLSSTMQGMGVYSGNTGNFITHMAASAVFTITSAMAGSATLTLRGSIDSTSGSFYYGDQPSYSNYSSDNAGVNLNYFVA